MEGDGKREYEVISSFKHTDVAFELFKLILLHGEHTHTHPHRTHAHIHVLCMHTCADMNRLFIMYRSSL